MAFLGAFFGTVYCTLAGASRASIIAYHPFGRIHFHPYSDNNFGPPLQIPQKRSAFMIIMIMEIDSDSLLGIFGSHWDHWRSLTNRKLLFPYDSYDR